VTRRRLRQAQSRGCPADMDLAQQRIEHAQQIEVDG
jgi:hypothetical protein